jgi:acetolactate synthase I/II/III large subunit
MPESKVRTGAQVLVDALAIQGVDLVFCVPGESYLAALDALYDRRKTIRLVVCRHEAAAANMSEASGKLTGRPGVCFVTRGPGATHASTGLHTAFQDSTPMLMFVGQVPRRHQHRECFQELDYPQTFGPGLSKWTAQIDDPKRIPEFVSRAFHIAVNERPGPVVLALPEDVLTESCEVADTGPYELVQAAPEPGKLTTLRQLLADARRPVLVLGGSGWSQNARSDIRAFAEKFQLPTAVVFRRQDLFDNHDDLYVGDLGFGVNPALAQRVRDSDLLLAIGTRLGEAATSGYTLVDIPQPRQILVHVHAGAEELGKIYRAALMIHSGMAVFAATAREMPPLEEVPWADWTRSARADYLSNAQPPASLAELDLGQIVAGLNDRLPRDAIICNGAGNYTTWIHRFYQYPGQQSQLAPTSGAMGYGVPAAIAAKLIHPDRPVIAFAGDGCFLMSCHELATAVRYRLAIIFLVINNGSYGTIRMHQEQRYPERVYGSDLTNPDFVTLAQAFGLSAERVVQTKEFWGALERAQQSGGPALIELVTDVEYISPRTTLSELRQRSMGNKTQAR